MGCHLNTYYFLCFLFEEEKFLHFLNKYIDRLGRPSAGKIYNIYNQYLIDEFVDRSIHRSFGHA